MLHIHVFLFTSQFNEYMTSTAIGDEIRTRWISMNETHPPSYYGNNWEKDREGGTSHVNVLAENGDAVSGTNTVNFL